MADDRAELADAGHGGAGSSLDHAKSRVYDFDSICINLAGLTGFQLAVVCDKGGAIIAENDRSAGRLNVAESADALFEVCREASIGCKEMEIGPLLNGQVAGKWGRIFIKSLQGNLVFCFCDSASKGADVQAKIDRIVESCSKLVDA